MSASKSLLLRPAAGHKKAPPIYGYLDWCGWLAQDVLALDGWLAGSDQQEPVVRLHLDHTSSAQALQLRYPRTDLEPIPGARGRFFALPVPRSARAAFLTGGVEVSIDGIWYHWTGSSALPIAPDLATWIHHPASAWAPERLGLLREFLVLATERLHIDACDQVFLRSSKSCAALEGAQAGSEATETWVRWPEVDLGLAVERAIAVSDTAIVVCGWAIGASAHELLTLSTGDGARANLLFADAVTYTREDLKGEETNGPPQPKSAGFCALFGLPRPFGKGSHLRLSMATAKGTPRVALPPLDTEPTMARSLLLDHCAHFDVTDPEALDRHIGPALQALDLAIAQETRPLRLAYTATRARTGGRGPRRRVRIETTLVLTLQTAADTLEPLLGCLAQECDSSEVEILAAMPRGSLGDDYRSWLYGLEHLYGLPLQVLETGDPFRLAAVRNHLSRRARGDHLVFLGNNVLPMHRGWLRRLDEATRDGDRDTLAGAVILSADGTISEAGLWPHRSPAEDRTKLEPGLAGMPIRLLAQTDLRSVPAIGSSCLAIRRDVFERLGGFNELFLGDATAAADLCSRAADRGAGVCVVPTAQLARIDHRPELPSWQEDFDHWLAGRLSPLGVAWPSSRQLSRVIAPLEPVISGTGKD